ncbi:MAG: hypothetical protein QXQ68_08710 [Candidatus Nitrosocaldaceae archaeon]
MSLQVYDEAIKQFLRFVNIKLNLIKTTEVVTYNVIEQVKYSINKFVQEQGKKVFNDVYNSNVYDIDSTMLMHELSKVNDISILDYCIKDLNQLLILATKNKIENDVYAVDSNEFYDSLYDLLGWFFVHKRVYPALHFDDFTITRDEINEFSKNMQKMRDYYHMKNIKERIFMQARGMLIEQKIKEMLSKKHHVLESSGYECDLIVNGYSIDVKSHISNVYRLPAHRYFNGTWEYVLFVKVEQMNQDMFKCRYSEVMAKDLLYHMSINYSTMLLVNLQ